LVIFCILLDARWANIRYEGLEDQISKHWKAKDLIISNSI